MDKILVTGSSGFIGFHLAEALMSDGFEVIGCDNLNDYYDVNLKKSRQNILQDKENFINYNINIENLDDLRQIFKKEKPTFVVHLAAQAGVRYSLENPKKYLGSNIIGTFNVLECCKENPVKHLLHASTSSIYGANISMPYKEIDKADSQISFYAASKKAAEAILHTYSSLWEIPVTAFRFFTVYGPWGRPDMAFFKFTKNIIEGIPIDIFNHGKMKRDFTYIDDIIKSIILLKDVVPHNQNSKKPNYKNDSLSPVAPYRVVNIGNSKPVKLLDFINEIEKAIGKDAIRNYQNMQKADVYETHADVTLLHELIGYIPNTPINKGIGNFVEWYKKYYKV